MHWNRFDIAEAWYLYLSHYHGGQWSREYARLCKLTQSFSPSPCLRYDSLSENGQAIYDALASERED